MKKSLIMFGILLSFTGISHATLIQLPNAEILTQRLQAQDLGHFLLKSDIVKKLANKKKTTIEIIMEVIIAVHTYNNYWELPTECRINMLQRKAAIIKAILFDFPEVITELQKKNLL